ncbi:MAG: HEAT repeat domain-containing protein, partial [Patescibacteria group bacterium]|nr:HEAT repeat domain-containing protein [Patescibacteria group bacterium]
DARKAGLTPENIRKALLERGWAVNEVDEVLRIFSSPKTPAAPSPVQRKSANGKIFATVGLIFIVLGFIGIGTIVLLGKGYFKKPSVPPATVQPQEKAAPSQAAKISVGPLPTDQASATVGPNGGEISGKTGLKMVIPPGTLEYDLPIKISLLSVDQQMAGALVDTDLTPVAVLSVDMFSGGRGGGGLLNFLVSPAYASYASYEIPLDIKMPIASGYSGPVMLAEIANYDGIMSAVAIDGAVAQDGFVHFEPPTYQGTLHQILNSMFAVYAIPDSVLFQKNIKWSDNPPIVGAVVSGPYRSVISVSNEQGIIVLPIPRDGEAYVYGYSPSYDIRFAGHRKVTGEWEDVVSPPVVDKYTRLNERAIPTILDQLHNTRLNDDWSYRVDAINALVKRNYPQAVAELCRVVKEDPEEHVRQEAVSALRELPAQAETVPCLQSALKDENEYVKHGAEDALKENSIQNDYEVSYCHELHDAQKSEECNLKYAGPLTGNFGVNPPPPKSNVTWTAYPEGAVEFKFSYPASWRVDATGNPIVIESYTKGKYSADQKPSGGDIKIEVHSSDQKFDSTQAIYDYVENLGRNDADDECAARETSAAFGLGKINDSVIGVKYTFQCRGEQQGNEDYVKYYIKSKTGKLIMIKVFGANDDNSIVFEFLSHFHLK